MGVNMNSILNYDSRSEPTVDARDHVWNVTSFTFRSLRNFKCRTKFEVVCLCRLSSSPRICCTLQSVFCWPPRNVCTRTTDTLWYHLFFVGAFPTIWRRSNLIGCCACGSRTQREMQGVCSFRTSIFNFCVLVKVEVFSSQKTQV